MSQPVRQDISERDRQIVGFVGAAGIASTRQIERLAFPAGEHGSALSAARRTRRVLSRLTEQGYLSRLDRRLGGVRAGSSSYLYQVGPAGKRLLDRSGRARNWAPSERFIDHCLAGAEIHVALVEAQRSRRLQGLVVDHEPVTWRRFTGHGGQIETLKPDLQIGLETPDGWRLRWFVEVDRASEHLPTVLAKCRLYQRYWFSGAEKAIDEVFPRVLWSVPHEPRREQLQAAIDRSRQLTGDLFRVATSQQTLATLMATDIPTTKGGEQ